MGPSMRSIVRLSIWFLCFFILSNNWSILAQESPHSSETIILSSGSKVGVYHQVAKGIQEVINKKYHNLNIAVLPSRGSAHNISRLQEGIADWAIVQRDVAVKNYYSDNSSYHNFEVLMPLFPEAVQIFVHPYSNEDTSRVFSFSTLIEMLKNRKIEQIAIGPEGSGSNQAMKNIFALFGLTDEHYFIESSFEDAFKNFKSGNLQALATVWALPLNIIYQNQSNDIAFVTFKRSDISRILSHVNTLDKINIPIGTYPNQPTEIQTVGTWAILISDKQITKQTQFALPDSKNIITDILSQRQDVRSLLPIALSYNQNGPFNITGQTESPRISLTSSQPQNFFRGLPLSSGTDEIFSQSNFHLKLLSIVLLILLILTIVAFSVKPIR